MLSVDAGSLEVLLENDSHGRVENEVDVGRVRRISEVTVDLFRLLIHAFKPIPYVLGRFRIVTGTCTLHNSPPPFLIKYKQAILQLLDRDTSHDKHLFYQPDYFNQTKRKERPIARLVYA